jgi:hypothetical protein
MEINNEWLCGVDLAVGLGVWISWNSNLLAQEKVFPGMTVEK